MIQRITRSAASSWMPRRSKSAHKGDMGHVYVLAGSRGMVGAAILSASAALRSGAGLVRLGVVRSQQPIAVRKLPPEVMTEGFAENSSGGFAVSSFAFFEKSIRQFRADVLAIGPGLGSFTSVKTGVQKLIARVGVPTVLDADGLNAFQKNQRFLASHKGELVITPHPGELSRLLNVSMRRIAGDRIRHARLAAQRFRCVCLLKGDKTVVTDGKQIWINSTGNPGMASGGMGDVLTGIIAALWGQMNRTDSSAALRAAALGAYLHGLAGDLAAKKFSEPALTASDLIDFLPNAIKTIYR